MFVRSTAKRWRFPYIYDLPKGSHSSAPQTVDAIRRTNNWWARLTGSKLNFLSEHYHAKRLTTFPRHSMYWCHSLLITLICFLASIVVVFSSDYLVGLLSTNLTKYWPWKGTLCLLVFSAITCFLVLLRYVTMSVTYHAFFYLSSYYEKDSNSSLFKRPEGDSIR